MRSSDPTNLPAHLVDATPDSDSIVRVNETQPKKRKSCAPMTQGGRRQRACYDVGGTIENALYEMFSTARLEALQRTNASGDIIFYGKCLEELQKLEELDDGEFIKAVNVLKDDKNAVAFMKIKGPRRLVWLRSLCQC